MTRHIAVPISFKWGALVREKAFKKGKLWLPSIAISQPKNLLRLFTDLLLERYFKQPKEIEIHIDPGPKVGSLVLPLSVKQFWVKEPLLVKIKSILRRNWSPKEEIVREATREIFAIEVFGSTDDFGDRLYNNITWYYHQDWKVESLTEADTKKVAGLDSMTILTRMKIGEQFIPALGLKLAQKNIEICKLTRLDF